jgi:hypothetical protein
MLVLINLEMVNFLSRIQLQPTIRVKLLEVIKGRSPSEIGAILLYLDRFSDLRVIDQTLSNFLNQIKDKGT